MELPSMPASLVDEVCAALGVAVPADRSGLDRLYAAWCAAVPFDPVAKALAIAEGRRPPGDDPVEVATRWLETGLGSTCWGHTTVLAAIAGRAGLPVAIGVERMIIEELVDFHSFLVVTVDGERLLLDAIHPSGPALPMVAGARGTHPAYRVGIDEVGGRLEHWFEQLSNGERRRYAVLSTDLDCADIRSFCQVSIDHSGVGRRFFQRRRGTDRLVLLRPTPDGRAIEETGYLPEGQATRTITDLDEVLAAAGYRDNAVDWLVRAGLLDLSAGPRWAV